MYLFEKVVEEFKELLFTKKIHKKVVLQNYNKDEAIIKLKDVGAKEFFNNSQQKFKNAKNEIRGE